MFNKMCSALTHDHFVLVPSYWWLLSAWLHGY